MLYYHRKRMAGGHPALGALLAVVLGALVAGGGLLAHRAGQVQREGQRAEACGRGCAHRDLVERELAEELTGVRGPPAVEDEQAVVRHDHGPVPTPRLTDAEAHLRLAAARPLRAAPTTVIRLPSTEKSISATSKWSG